MGNEILFVPTKVRQRRPCIRGGAALSSPRPTLGRRAPAGPTPAGDNPPNDTRGEMVLAAYGSSLSRANTEESSLDTLVRRLDQPLPFRVSASASQLAVWRRAGPRARARHPHAPPPALPLSAPPKPAHLPAQTKTTIPYKDQERKCSSFPPPLKDIRFTMATYITLTQLLGFAGIFFVPYCKARAARSR